MWEQSPPPTTPEGRCVLLLEIQLHFSTETTEAFLFFFRTLILTFATGSVWLCFAVKPCCLDLTEAGWEGQYWALGFVICKSLKHAIMVMKCSGGELGECRGSAEVLYTSGVLSSGHRDWVVSVLWELSSIATAFPPDPGHLNAITLTLELTSICRQRSHLEKEMYYFLSRVSSTPWHPGITLSELWWMEK